jgi:meiotic recombination protein DMC1
MTYEADILQMSLGDACRASVQRHVFSSGCPSIDSLLGGGFSTQELVELYGASRSGKTQVAFQTAVVAAGEGARVTFIDTEGTFRPERLAMIAEARGLVPEEVLRLVFWRRATTVAEQISTVRDLEEDQRIAASRLIVVDTVGKNFALEYEGQKRMLERQSRLVVYLNALARDAYVHNRAVVLTSRVASVGGQHDEVGRERREVDIGGNTLRRFVHSVLHLQRSGGSRIAVSLEDMPEGATRTAGCRVTDDGVVDSDTLVGRVSD